MTYSVSDNVEQEIKRHGSSTRSIEREGIPTELLINIRKNPGPGIDYRIIHDDSFNYLFLITVEYFSAGEVKITRKESSIPNSLEVTYTREIKLKSEKKLEEDIKDGLKDEFDFEDELKALKLGRDYFGITQK